MSRSPGAAEGGGTLSLAALLSALSLALDLTEGQPMGHAVRTCLIGLRMADALGLPPAERDALHLALLLKDAGCSSNAARMYALFGGDERAAKADSRLCDWCRAPAGVWFALRHTLPGGALPARAAKLRGLCRLPGRVIDDLTATRCAEGAEIARLLDLGEEVAGTIYRLDEHWDGRGAPHGLRGAAIPRLARAACLAQTLEAFAAARGTERAYAVARERAGRWFDPEMVRAAASFERDARFWEGLRASPGTLLEAATGPALRRRMTGASLEAVCAAFARVVDAKSPFTAAHSSRVAGYAVAAARRLGLSPAACDHVRHAGLLHDLGKLGVPNRVLDKPGPLTEAEFALVRRHPLHTEQILRNIPSFRAVAEIAGAHHERLDGSGYCRGARAPELTREMRLLAVADVFDALTARRPYREPLSPERALALLGAEADSGKLDADCVAALKEALPAPEEAGRPAAEAAAPRAAGAPPAF